MKNIYIMLCGFGLAAFTANAEVLSPEQAVARAMSGGPACVASISGQKVQPELVFTQYSNSIPTAYVFNAPTAQGYMVLAADDVAKPVLGYSDNGTIDPENMAPAFKYWLSMYSDEIANARRAGAAPYQESRAADTWASIPPLCTTLWDQSAPYNDLCPAERGRRTVTGCVATSMSQMMKYHNYPPKGIGHNKYTAAGQTLDVNFEDYTFDWANMLDQYEATSTEAQRLAVAQLMYCAGVSVNMDYSYTMSGAISRTIPGALIDNFGYDKSCYWAQRDYYSYSAWQNMIYNEISNNRPVIYNGTTADQEGHSFICDGYSTDGYFHFNWGWSGLSDGYYQLTALDPMSQGIGGATTANDGFNYSQGAIFNAKRPEANSNYTYMLYSPGEFKISSAASSLGSTVKVTSTVYNGTVVPVSGTYGVTITKSDGTSQYVRSELLEDLEPNYGFGSFNFVLPTNLTNGTYTVRPTWINNVTKEELNILYPITKVSSYTMTVNGRQVTFKPNQIEASVEIKDITIESPETYIEKRIVFNVEVANNSEYEYYNTIQAGLFDTKAKSGAKPISVGGTVLVDVEPGQTAEYSYTTSFGGISAGTYNLCFYNVATLEWISEPIAIQMKKAPTSAQTKIKVTDFELVNMVDGEIDDPNNLIFAFDIECTKGLFDKQLVIGICRGAEEYWRGGNLLTPNIFLYSGESQHIQVTGAMTSSSSVGTTYKAFLYNGSNPSATRVAGPIEFTLVKSLGISSVEADQPAQIEHYNLQGIKVEGDLAPGLYIRVARNADGTSTSTKLQVK